MRKRWAVAATLVVAGLVAVQLAQGWWVVGHGTITEAAASSLPDEMPAFFRAAGKSLNYLAGDPDRWKNRECKNLKDAEEPHHFLDLEDLEGAEIPRERFAGIALILKLNKQPQSVGLLPYAIMEGYERLAVAFLDYRNDPSNPAIPMKCIVYGGTMAHYTTDAAMPLHTTKNYNGKPGPDGKLLQKGIHAKIDGFPELNKFTAEEIARGLQAKVVPDMWDYVTKFILDSHAQVERCYALDATGSFDKPTPESREFILQRCRAGAQFTMDVWYNAWLKSATLPQQKF